MRLRDQLASSLNFAKARDIELAWIDGQIDMSAGRTDTSAMSEGKGQESMDTKDNKEEGYNFAVKFFVRTFKHDFDLFAYTCLHFIHH